MANCRSGRKHHKAAMALRNPIDRVADQKPYYYSGKHRRRGMNVRVIADPAGRLIRASAALPGSVHDLTAARTHAIIDTLSRKKVMTFAMQRPARRAAGPT